MGCTLPHFIDGCLTIIFLFFCPTKSCAEMAEDRAVWGNGALHTARAPFFIFHFTTTLRGLRFPQDLSLDPEEHIKSHASRWSHFLRLVRS